MELFRPAQQMGKPRNLSTDVQYFLKCSEKYVTMQTILLPGYYNEPPRPRHVHFRVTLNGTQWDRQGTNQDFIGKY